MDFKEDFPAYPKEGTYLDSATINLLPKSTILAQKEFNEYMGSTPRKVFYERSRKTTNIYLDTKEKLVAKYGLRVENYAFNPNADYAWNQILRSIVEMKQSEEKKLQVIANIFDHNSLLAPLQYLSKLNQIDLQIFPQFTKELLEEIADENTLIALNHISPILGKYREFDRISKVAKSHGSMLAIDYSRSAAQSKIDLSVTDIAIIDPSTDLLGPQGVGITILKDNFIESLENPFPGSGSVKYVSSKTIEQLNSIEKFETGNVNMLGVAGLLGSLQYLDDKFSKVLQKREEVQSELRSRLKEMDFVSIIEYDDLLGSADGNIVGVTLKDLSIHDTVLMLEEIADIEVRSGRLCSHSGLDYLNLDDVMQISTHIYNDATDVERLIKGLNEISNIF